MNTLIFASNNIDKANEIRSVAGNFYQILTLKEAGINIEIPEPHDTLEANASEKSHVINKLSGKNCFSEDTGLEVEELNGEPGVKSARFSGPLADSQANIDKLLSCLNKISNRQARFRTVVSLILNNKEYFFEGLCSGSITSFQRGKNGFGYDPVFIPDGASKTFAEMDMAEKNQYSHRKKAIEKLLYFLSQNWKKTSC